MSVFKKLFMPSEEMDEDMSEAYQEEQSEMMPDGDTGSEDGELAVDVYQTKDSVVVKSTIAGVKPEDLDIAVTDNMVTIRGERRQEQRVSEGDYLYQECYWGSFSRSFSLPVEVDADEAQAELRDGILTLTLPKIAQTRTKKVRIST